MSLSEFVRSVVWGAPFGDVYPPRDPPVLAGIRGRTAALRLLRRYLSELTFYRVGAELSKATGSADTVFGPPVPFRIPADDIYIDRPEKVEEMSLPYLAFRPGRGVYESLGLTSYLDESTRDVYGLGTVLQRQSDYVETVSLDLSAAKSAERNALVIGLEAALVPTAQMYGLRFRMPAYYDQLVRFTLLSSQNNDDQAADGRRDATLELEMAFTVVTPVNYVGFRPVITVTVASEETLSIEVEEGVEP